MTVTLETQLENYTLEKEIGRGDLTMAYQARRKSDQALVTIKIVPPQFTFDEIFVRRFKDAARQAIRLEHPNIVRTYEAGQEEDVLYIVRDFLVNLWETGFAALGRFGGYLVLGAGVVIPVFIIMRLFSLRK